MYIGAHKICIIFDNAFSDMSLFLLLLLLLLLVLLFGCSCSQHVGRRLGIYFLPARSSRSYRRRHVSINFEPNRKQPTVNSKQQTPKGHTVHMSGSSTPYRGSLWTWGRAVGAVALPIASEGVSSCWKQITRRYYNYIPSPDWNQLFTSMGLRALLLYHGGRDSLESKT